MKTAWGETLLKFGLTGAGDAMSASLGTMGIVKEDSISLDPTDGTKLQLFGSGHVLLDQLTNEPTLTLKAIIVGIPDAIKEAFWGAETTGVGDASTTEVSSLVNSKKFSVVMETKVVGSETFEAPLCSISMTPLISEKEGWTASVTIDILKGATGKLFKFGRVAAE